MSDEKETRDLPPGMLHSALGPVIFRRFEEMWCLDTRAVRDHARKNTLLCDTSIENLKYRSA